jgi:hypothetical protein
MSVNQESYNEILDLLARTSSAEVLAFRPSADSQERVRYLLDRNESGEMNEDEAAELERFGELEHLIQLVKARAQVYVSDLVRVADDRK